MSTAIGLIAVGQKASSSDPDLIDAMFLFNHPVWTWQDYQGTPERILRILKSLDEAKPETTYAPPT